MSKKNTPPAYGESSGPMIVACQWKRSSPTGPAEQFPGGSLPSSNNSLWILLRAIVAEESSKKVKNSGDKNMNGKASRRFGVCEWEENNASVQLSG